MAKNSNFGLSKINFILMGVACVIVIIGFALMAGKPSGVVFNPDIYSFRRITVAPMVSFAGFLFMIFAILYKPKNENEVKDK